MMKLGKQEIEIDDEFTDPKLYREWGIKLTRMGQYRKAIAIFEKSMKCSEHDDVRTLLGICTALSNFTRYVEADEYATKAKNIAPDNNEVKYMKISTLFKLGEFGYSLIDSYEGLKQRRTPFEWGVFQGTEAVNDCVGGNTTPIALWLLYPWIQSLEEYRADLIARLGEEEDEFEGIGEDESKFKVNDATFQREAYLKRLYRVIARKILDYLAIDKFFAENLLDHLEVLECPNKESTNKLLYYVNRTYGKSCFRQDILRTRKPLYVSIFKKRDIPLGHKLKINFEKHLYKQNILIKADFLLKKLHGLRMRRDYIRFFSLVDRIKEEFDSYTVTMFPAKEKCLNELYKIVAWTYIDTRNLLCFEDELSKEIFIKHHLGLYELKLPRASDLAWIPTVNKKRAVKVFRRRLAMASQPLELSWLFHEFTKYLVEIHRYDLARFFVKKAREQSTLAKSEQWVLNSHHLMMKIEMDQHNKNEAKESAQLALASANKLGLDFLINFYSRVVEFLTDYDIEEFMQSDGILTRQRLILDLVPVDMKPTVDYLFRAMNAVPAKRRLSVMPGCKPRDYEFKIPCKRSSVKIAPSKDPAKEARRALIKLHESSKRERGYVDFEKYE